jgi:hypothetical protein
MVTYGTAWVLLQRCLKVFEGYPPIFLDVLRRTDPRTVAEHGIFTRQAEAMPREGWGRGRVTLVGDAAHPVRPTGRALSDRAPGRVPGSLQEVVLPPMPFPGSVKTWAGLSWGFLSVPCQRQGCDSGQGSDGAPAHAPQPPRGRGSCPCPGWVCTQGRVMLCTGLMLLGLLRLHLS